MENNGLTGGLFSSMGSSGMLELEMSLHPHQPQPQQNPHHLQPHQHQHQQHLPIVGYGHHEADQNPQAQRPVKQAYPYAPKSKSQLTLSDEDEPGLTAEDSAGDGSRKASPWQRMKWTDSMVRLLIMVVFYIGDEAGSEGDAAGKKKGGGLLQKKGKWKSVSRAMMERGFYVSPQQCEDKFNDLNKRYKRVNDILGKGTACQVVENQSLLETMDHLTPKRKEEVRKLLNSKHLFFREMCAYHNSCGGGGGSGANRSPEVAAEPSHIQQQQRCFHSTENAPNVANLVRAEPEGSKMVKVGSGDEEEDDDEEDDNDDDDEEEEDEVVEGGLRSHDHGLEEEDEDERCLKKRARKGVLPLPSPSPSPSLSPLVQQLSSEMTSVVQDGTKSPWEKRQWMKVRLVQLEEQRVGYQCEAFELEKQRLKWVKFSSKKEREMEREKLKNERMRLENERMVLLLRQKELELLDLQQLQQNCSNKRSDPSSING